MSKSGSPEYKIDNQHKSPNQPWFGAETGYETLQRKRRNKVLSRPKPTQDLSRNKVERLNRRNSQKTSHQAERFIQARLDRMK
jgi:hypothetical protein